MASEREWLEEVASGSGLRLEVECDGAGWWVRLCCPAGGNAIVSPDRASDSEVAACQHLQAHIRRLAVDAFTADGDSLMKANRDFVAVSERYLGLVDDVLAGHDLRGALSQAHAQETLRRFRERTAQMKRDLVGVRGHLRVVRKADGEGNDG